jgi:hypothetical protein
MDYINANAYAGVKLKVISNLYYPGYNADNVQSSCKDAGTGATVNCATTFLPVMAKMNYWMCEYARQKGFKCADSFAQYMGADYDSNGDGQIDSDALRYVAGESEASYVTRITSTLRPRCATPTHFVSSSSSYDYIQSDDTHPTYTGGTVSAGLLGRQHRHGRAALHQLQRRQEPDLEPLRATSAWAGRCRHLQPHQPGAPIGAFLLLRRCSRPAGWPGSCLAPIRRPKRPRWLTLPCLPPALPLKTRAWRCGGFRKTSPRGKPPRQHILWSRTWKGTTIRPAISLLMSRAAHNPAWLKSSPD